jgi:hypothetical protein
MRQQIAQGFDFVNFGVVNREEVLESIGGGNGYSLPLPR